MSRDPNVTVHIKNADQVENSEALQEAVEKRCQHLGEEFREADRFEVTIGHEGNGAEAHARATGKNTDVASHASAEDERQAADAALDRLERELRSRHDKRIFAPRREARRAKAAEKGR